MKYRLPSKKRLTVWVVGLLLLLVLLPGALLMGLAWSLYERPQWLLPHINQYLAAQDIRIDELRLAPEGWDRLSFDYLKLDYQGSELEFHQLRLQLKSPVSAKRIWQLLAGEASTPPPGSTDWLMAQLQKVSYQDAGFSLTPELLLPGGDDGGQSLALDLNSVPEIALGPTRISLQPEAGVSDTPNTSLTLNEAGNTPSFTLMLQKLQLSPSGQLVTELATRLQGVQQETHSGTQTRQETPLLALTADLKAKLANGAPAWRLTSQLHLKALQQALASVEQDPAAAPLISAFKLDEIVNAELMPSLGGDLFSQLTLDLTQGNIDSRHCWSTPTIAMPGLEQVALKITPLPLEAKAHNSLTDSPLCPSSNVAASFNANPKASANAKAEVKDSDGAGLRFRFSGSTSEQIFELAPLRLTLSTTPAQRQALLALLAATPAQTSATKAAELESQLAQLQQVLAQEPAEKKQVKPLIAAIELTLDQGLDAEFKPTKDNDTKGNETSMRVSLPSLTVRPLLPALMTEKQQASFGAPINRPSVAELSPAALSNGERPSLLLTLENLQLQLPKAARAQQDTSVSLPQSAKPQGLNSTGFGLSSSGSSGSSSPNSSDSKPLSAEQRLELALQQAIQGLQLSLNQLPLEQASTDWRLEASLPSGFRWQSAAAELQLNEGASLNKGASMALSGKLALEPTSEGQQLNFSLAANPGFSTGAIQAGIEDKSIQLLGFKLSLLDPLSGSFNQGKLKLSLPAVSSQLGELQAKSGPLALSIAQTSLLSPGLSRTLDANLNQKRHLPLLSQLLDERFASRLNLAFDGLNLSQTRHTKLGPRTETLLNLGYGSFSQTIDWQDNRLISEENWQLDNIPLNSRHDFMPIWPKRAKDPLGYRLNSRWTLDTDLADIKALAAKNLPLPPELVLRGETHMIADLKLEGLGRALQLQLDFNPLLSDLSGSISQLPFEGANLSALCRLTLAKEAKAPAEAELNCQQLKASVQAFNPGVLLTNLGLEGQLSLTPELDSNQSTQAKLLPGFRDADIQVRGQGELLKGQMLLPSFRLRLNAPSNAYLVLQGLSLEELLAIQPQEGIYADGIFDGVLPVFITDGQVSVKGGRLAARAPGGLIKVGNNPAVAQMRAGQPYLDFAFSTLEHLQYSTLASTYDMAPDGEAWLKVEVKGKAEGIERPIHLNYSHEENMLQLLRSLTIGDKLQTQIEASMQ
ncbi:YdbH domain-containing protein [Shewanella algae]|uniref:YdbH domain-containing protein n=1 Tax=Shewanella algae TaxID=38313 RepID=UPI001AAE9E81|nr:YdbH domain-containing protein [Shewanella algae]MBO2662170.1 YdbH domain-containing protein [Shewanella algae]MCL1055451.1 YdbH domain-containing protein [Shewanella algae]MDV2960848.1 YdbH domain-containing protein [Shewanella algae]